MLLDLESGTQKKEASYIAEEYYFALGLESERADEYERSYPVRRSGTSYDGSMYGRRRTEHGDRSPPARGGYDRDGYRQPDRRPWDRSPRGYGEEPLNMRSLMDILERRDRDNERRRREDEGKRTINELTQDMGVIATELRNLKENPPVVTPAGESDYEKTLKHTIDRQDDNARELRDLLKEERAESKSDVKELREIYDSRFERQKGDFKDELERRGRPYDSKGYKDDGFRLAGEGLHEMADVLRGRGSPVKIIIEGLGALTGEGGQAPGRERGRPSSVADLVGAEYTEG